MKQSKVFCSNCQHHIVYMPSKQNQNIHRCKLHYRSEVTPVRIIKHHEECSVLNKDNDCKHFHPVRKTLIEKLFGCE